MYEKILSIARKMPFLSGDSSFAQLIRTYIVGGFNLVFGLGINYIFQFFILITTYVILDFLSLIGYAILANKMITWVKANAKIINTISACVLIVIAAIIAFMQQY